jgi:hypothetical protein
MPSVQCSKPSPFQAIRAYPNFFTLSFQKERVASLSEPGEVSNPA